MTLEEKIQYLENLEQNGIQIANLPINYISKDGIIINNVLINIRKYYFKNLMTVEQSEPFLFVQIGKIIQFCHSVINRETFRSF